MPNDPGQTDAQRDRSVAAPRLQRLLNLVPVIRANPGITISVIRVLGGFSSPRETREELGRLMLFGVPPFSPADFMEVHIDGEDRVTLHFPQGLEQPLALTPEEWIAVQRVVTQHLEFHASEGPSADLLRSLLARMSAVPVSVDTGDPSAQRRRIVEEAMADGVQIQFLYRTLSSKEPEIRRVDPWAIFQNRGFVYVVGFCHLRRAPRHFHLERADDLVILEVEREMNPPANLAGILNDSPFFQDARKGFAVEIAFAPHLQSAVERYLSARGTSSSPATGAPAAPGGWKRASCPVRDSFWFRAMIRSFGPGIVILSPAHMRKSFLKEMDEIAVPAPLKK